jgi:hypothetical protein
LEKIKNEQKIREIFLALENLSLYDYAGLKPTIFDHITAIQRGILARPIGLILGLDKTHCSSSHLATNSTHAISRYRHTP